MAKIELTETQLMLIIMATEIAIKWALQQVADLSEVEIERLINDEEIRTATLMSQLKKTGG